MIKRIYLLGFVLLLCLSGHAQTPLTLEQCLLRAVESNIQVQISENTVNGSQLAYTQRKFDFLPSVSANIPLNKSFGNSADIFTQQIAVSPWTSNPSLNASIVAFRGLAKWNDLKNAEYTLSSNQYSMEDLKNDIRLNVCLAFFQVLFATDNLEIGENRLDLLTKQRDKVQKEFEAGSKTQGDVYGLNSQLAAERVNIVNQQNIYDRALLDLVLTLNMDPKESYELVRPALLDAPVSELGDIDAIFQASRLNNPGVLKQEFKLLAAKYAVNSARAAYLPTLSVGFGIGSFYSSNAKERIGYALVDGFPQILYGDRIPIMTQFNSNFAKTLAISMNIPLFTRLTTRQNFLQTKISQSNAELVVQSEENDLYKSIQQAYLDATAADAKFAATIQQMESLNESFRYAEARFNAGVLDFFSYLEVLNNKTKAEIEQVQAQYDLILKRKIIDIYQGKPIGF